MKTAILYTWRHLLLQIGYSDVSRLVCIMKIVGKQSVRLIEVVLVSGILFVCLFLTFFTSIET